MLSRREVLVGSSLSLAMPYVPAQAMQAVQQMSANAESAEVRIRAEHATAEAVPFLEACAGQCSRSAKAEARIESNVRSSSIWFGDSVVLHPRFAPDAGASLGTTIATHAAARSLRAFETWSDDDSRVAASFALEPFAVLVNREKAEARGASPTLQGMASRNLVTRFVLPSSNGQGHGGWVMPVLAAHLPMRANPSAADLFLTGDALHALEKLQTETLKLMEMVGEEQLNGTQLFEAWADPADSLAAIYANPLVLERWLNAAGRQDQFLVRPLSEFLPSSAPGLQRVLAMQLGPKLQKNDHALELGAAISRHVTAPEMSGRVSEIFPGFLSLHDTRLPALCPVYGFDAYSAMDRLDVWADLGFAFSVLKPLVKASADGRSPHEAALLTASAGFHALSAYELARRTRPLGARAAV